MHFESRVKVSRFGIFFRLDFRDLGRLCVGEINGWFTPEELTWPAVNEHKQKGNSAKTREANLEPFTFHQHSGIIEIDRVVHDNTVI